MLRAMLDSSFTDILPDPIAGATRDRYFVMRHVRLGGISPCVSQRRPIVSVSRVGISHDGHWAMVYVGSQGDWLAGAGYLHVLYDDAGIWRVRYSHLLWIS